MWWVAGWWEDKWCAVDDGWAVCSIVVCCSVDSSSPMAEATDGGLTFSVGLFIKYNCVNVPATCFIIHMKSAVPLTDPWAVELLVTLGLILFGEPGLLEVFESFSISGIISM